MTKILALDQSSRITGWAVFEDDKLIDSGKFTVSDDDIGIRLVKIRKKVLELISQFEIDKVYFEDIQLQGNVTNNVQTFKVLAEVFGVIYETLKEIDMPNETVLAGTWKSKLGIKGARRDEQKRNAQVYVQNTYGKKVSQDESDAICIGAYAVLNTPQTSDVFDWSN